MTDFEEFDRSGYKHVPPSQRRRQEMEARLAGTPFAPDAPPAPRPRPRKRKPSDDWEPIVTYDDKNEWGEPIKIKVHRRYGHPRFERITIDAPGHLTWLWLVDGQSHRERADAEAALALVEPTGRLVLGSPALTKLRNGGIKAAPLPKHVTVGDDARGSGGDD